MPDPRNNCTFWAWRKIPLMELELAVCPASIVTRHVNEIRGLFAPIEDVLFRVYADIPDSILIIEGRIP